MQDLIKRNFWVVGALTVVICAVFAAKATGSIVTAKFLGDSTTGPKITPITQVAQTDTTPTRDKSGTPLQARNIFCSDCAPPTPAESTNTTTDSSGVVITSLPLQLLATSVGATDKSSYASVANTATQAAGSYGIDDTLPGATGKIIAIRYKYVDFMHNGHTERLVIDGAVAPPPVVAVAEPEKKDENKDDLASSVESGIKKIDDTTFEIDKSLVDKALENPMALAKGARIVPAMKNGKAEGFKLYAIRPSSVFAKLGLSNGDTLTAINGFELTTADKALEVYTKLREATNLELEVTRRGKPVTLKYSIK